MKLGLIGCGRMGRALALGAIEAGAVKAADLTAYDVEPAAIEALRAEAGEIAAAATLEEVLTSSDTLLLCTKPHDVPAVLGQMAASGGASSRILLVSIAAGVTLRTLEGHLPEGARVIRAMPNTPALIGKGAAAFTPGVAATPADGLVARRLLGAVGSVVEVKESLMDAVTGLSGSGPGYVYLLIEALIDGGVRNGLPRDQARELATQTVLGAAAMVRETGCHPALLKDMVTSPGGTTMAGLEVLEARAVRAACIEAVTAATRRSRELGAAD